MSQGDVLVDTHDGVRTITLHRPDKRNALTGETHAIVGKRVVRCDEDRLPAAIAQRYVGWTNREW